MKFPLLPALCLFMIFSACSNPGENTETENKATDTTATDIIAEPVTAHNSMNSLDWAGTYFGILPCADCEGVETSLEIGSALSYRITRKYIGKSNRLFSDTGVFSWSTDGNKITLQNSSGEFVKFFVGENYLLQLDADGNEISGDLAPNYRLNRQTEAAIATEVAPVKQKQQKSPAKKNETEKKVSPPVKKDPFIIEGDKWILIELNGKSIEQSGTETQQIYFMLDSAQNYITGFGGCNQFFGSYKISEPYQIKFQKMTTTLKACDQMESETALLKIFEKADNYTVNGNALSLNKAKMAPLARFMRK